MYRILIIEDQPTPRVDAQRALLARGHDVVAVDATSAISLLGIEDFDVVIAGLEPKGDVESEPTPIPPLRELVCLEGPLSMDRVTAAVADIEARDSLRKILSDAHDVVVETSDATMPLIGRSSVMRSVHRRVAMVATSEAPVLLGGESGTGKELVAQTIHARSRRGDKPLVIVNCAAFPDTLIEAELFGHERGAFTGAVQKRDGRFKAADGGTLFLDEVNSLSPSAQAKLLRVLQDGTFTPLGTNASIAVDVRLISATNQDLKALVASGAFRADLYYRIKVLDVDLPPVRERIGDFALLTAHFLKKHAPPGQNTVMSPRAWAAISHYPFPGNVRELEHAIQHAVVLANGSEIDLEHLPTDISATAEHPTVQRDGEIPPLAVAVREFEREYVARALRATRGNKTHAARLLGMSRKHLWEKMRRLGSDHESE